MGYGAIFTTECLGPDIPKEMVDKYSNAYRFTWNETEREYEFPIQSYFELKSHEEFIRDLQDLCDEDWGLDTWAVLLWEDGRVERLNLYTNTREELCSDYFLNQ